MIPIHFSTYTAFNIQTYRNIDRIDILIQILTKVSIKDRHIGDSNCPCAQRFFHVLSIGTLSL